ncbi:MAG: T9SS type A sorting domain-containing protein [Ignavibacteriales bacterium]|nr:hypothetical protein [Ignavibacteriaceae bacterium]QOJ27843.1 MAG: T9SS type A sorting domain-containing protein [Ignavibacteriales bacterium]
MHRQLLFLFFLLFLSEGLIPQTKENLIQSTSTSALTMSEVKKNIEDITELSQVAYTNANEKAPVIVGTSSYLYAIYEYKLGSSNRAIKIRISTNNGTSWNDWDLISNTTYNLGTPYAYIAGSKLYIVWQVEYSTTDYDIEFCSYNVGATPSGLSVTWVEQSGNNTFRPVVAVTSSDIYVGYVNGGTGKFQIRRSSNNGSSWSDIFTSSTNFVYPSTLLRVDGTASGTNMFVFNTKISNVDQIVVVSRMGSTTWSETYVSTSSGNKSGPSIGTYGNNWIVAFQGTSSNVKYFYKSSTASSPTEYTLATSATFPTVEMTDNPSGFVVCTFVKNQKVYKVTSGVAQLPTWSSEAALYTDDMPPSTDDFMGLHPSGSNAGVVFANPYQGSTSDYDVYYAGLATSGNCTLSIQPTTKNIGAEGGSFTISVTATCNWTASESANWITITPSSGNGNGSINVTVDPNTSFNSRSDIIAIASGTTGLICTITQSGASQSLMISPEEYSAPSANAGSFTITVSSNLNWTASSNQSWITVSPQNGSNNGTITVNYTANTTSSQRTGMVTVQGGLISVFCEISQPPATTNQLNINPTTYTASSSAAGSFPITVTSNVSWTASDDQTWITVTPTSGSNNGSVTVSYSENTSPTQRTGTVTITGGGITKTCPVTQPGPPTGSIVWQFNITVASGADNGALTIGQGEGATDGLDAQFGEAELPPMPPTGIFDGRMELPTTPFATPSLKDFRSSTITTALYTMRFQPGSGGYPMNFSWNPASLPANGMFTLKGVLSNGTLININMRTQSSYSLSDPDVSRLRIEYAQGIQSTVSYSSGWNLLSVPVNSSNMTRSAIFPASDLVYKYSTGYTSIPPTGLMENKIGYWVKFTSGGSVSLQGQMVIGNIPVVSGWNIIGPFHYSVPVSGITTNPAGILTTGFYGYNNGYTTPTTLESGKGYWVKASQAGNIILPPPAEEGSQGGGKEKDTPLAALHEISLTISDGAGGSQILKVGIDPSATDGLDPALGEQELPPAPPTGVFDVRLNLPVNPSIPSFVDYRQGTSSGGFTKIYTIKVQAGSGPWMTLNYNFTPYSTGQISGRLQAQSFDSTLDANISGVGSLIFSATEYSQLRLTLTFGSPVPVELTSFTGTAVNGKVLLNWATATEMNNKGFEVERRAAGAAWQNIGYVQGNGTTTEPRRYSFTDASLTKDGDYEYRLKQVDHNGDYEYSKVIAVNVSVTPENFVLHQNYPNPFNPSTQISYSLPSGSYVKLVLYDVIGNVAGYIYDGYQDAGHHSVNYDASHLTNGVYYYQITAGDFRAVKKLILMK